MTPQITRSYLVCATPRSGSTLLCRLLDRTGVAGHPEEYFEALRHSGEPRRPHEYFDRERHANIIERLAFREMPSEAGTHDPHPHWAAETYDRYLEWVLEQGATPNGVFGAKLMWGYLGDFASLLRGIEGLGGGLPVPELLARAFPGLRYVQITRQDKVRQAVSLWKAVQTQAWRGDARTAAETPAPQFSFRAINYLVRQLTAHDASWDAYFLGLGIEPLKITYEELAEAPEPVVRRVLAHLDVDPPPGLAVDAPGVTVQADSLSETWVRRVHDHLAALEGPEPAVPAPAR